MFVLDKDCLLALKYWLLILYNKAYNVFSVFPSLIDYLADHETHEAEDSHRNMSGRPHEEIDDVGEKRRVKAVDGLHSSQKAVGDGLGHQDDPHNQPGHQVAPHILPQLVFGQPAHHGEEAT